MDGYLETIPYAAENRRLLKEIYTYFPKLAQRTIPFANIDPSRMVQEQLQVLKELKVEYGFAGLKIQPFVVRAPILTLLEEGSPFVEFAREHNLPFLIHSSVGPSDIYSQCSDILTVAENNPDIRFCLAHNRRFDLASLEKVEALNNAWFDCSAHRIHCELAVQNSTGVAPVGKRFVSDYTNPTQVLADLAERFPTKLMWGTDSPAHSYASAFGGVNLELWSSYDEEVVCLNALSKELRAKVGWENTVRFLTGC